MNAPAQAPGLVRPAIAHLPFAIGGCGQVFAVQMDAPSLNTLDSLAMLIDAARGVSTILAEISSRGDFPIDPAACWAPVYLLDAASALQAAIPAGTAQHQPQGDAP